MSPKIRIVSYGLGVMGAGIARAALKKGSLQLVGAIDPHPKLAGRDVGEVLGLPERLGVVVEADASALLKRVEADVAVHATASDLRVVEPQILKCLEAGLDVVSTCEELSYPWKRHPEVARRIDEAARAKGGSVVGTGINPGYLMDALPLMLTAPCLRVDSIKVTRVLDSAKRRIPFQEKVGTNLTPEQFRAKIDSRAITGHVGLLESLQQLATGLGWTLDGLEETPPQPVIAERETPSGLGPVAAGKVIGLRSTARAMKAGKVVFQLDFLAHAGVKEEYDEVVVEGEPNIRQRVVGGVHGDVGTIAMLVNAIPRILETQPGLRTLLDLPLMRATS